MPFFRCLLPSLLLLLLSLLSCSSDSEYPYTIVEGDPCNTRLYKLPNGVKLYIAQTVGQPRVSAALYMPSVANDTLDKLYTQSVYSRDYQLLFARIGSDVSGASDFQGSTLLFNNIPSNELENWSKLMRGSFATFPDSLSVIFYGDVVYDDAVATIIRHFDDAVLFSSSVALCNYDVLSLLGSVRAHSCSNSKKIASLSDVRKEAKNSIQLLPSPPAKVVFPDTDKLKIKSFPEQPRMVVAECNDTVFTFTLSSHLNECPSSFLVLIKDYFAASLNAEKDTSVSVMQVTVDKGLHALDFSISGSVDNMQSAITHAINKYKSFADADKFYKYLLANSEAVDASKKCNENMAMQAAAYVIGGKRMCGMRELAKYSMDALFTFSNEIYFYGKEGDKVYALLLNVLNSPSIPSLDNFSAAGDTLARYLLLPADVDSAVTVTLVAPYESVEDYAAIALFNKAASLSNVEPSAFIYSCGALLSASDCVPFTREAFDAAKSFLLYDCSTYGNSWQSLFNEYGTYNACGYTSSQFYDALICLSFSDVEGFCARHKESVVTQLIVGRESSLNLRELKNNGGVVHLTSSELFGY